jgi:ubiquinone/menaquinone biosynthesis C-methylase UbiE
MSTEAKVLKEQVKERYGAIAQKYQAAPNASLIELEAAGPQEAASCCGPLCCSPAGASETGGQLYQVADGVSLSPTGTATDTTLAQALYGQAEIADLPNSVTDVSLGCGNPTAIASLKPGETVLDLGSGGGIDCFLAAKTVGPTGHVIGVDMTDSMLALANKNKAKIGATNVEFRKGEIEDLPVESDTVDIIISNCVINLSPDKDAVFREAVRVLKPGGRFVVSDMVTEGHFPEQLRANINAWAGCITGALDQEVYLDKMRQAGFVDIQVESRVSYGLEHVDLLDEQSREALTKDVDWSTVPADVRLYSARIVAYKPEK